MGETRTCRRCGDDLNNVEWLFDPCPASADGTHGTARPRGPKRPVTYDGKTYKVRKDKIEIPDLDAMPRMEALCWLVAETYPLNTNHRLPNPLAGMGGAIGLTVR